MTDQTRLLRRFFRRDAPKLARGLLGHILVRRLADGRELSGRIVETEAYLGIPDKAAHTYGGRRSKRNASMWLDGGHAYVYFTYGMHWCFNIVAEREGRPSACLIRALEPAEGITAMRRRRSDRISRPLRDTDLCSGPAKLTEALGIDKHLDGTDLTTSDTLYLRRGRAVRRERVAVATRIGVAYAEEWADKPLRFFIRGNPHVSRTDGSTSDLY